MGARTRRNTVLDTLSSPLLLVSDQSLHVLPTRDHTPEPREGPLGSYVSPFLPSVLSTIETGVRR